MSTGHANSPADMMSRLETMILMGMELPLLAIRQQMAAGIDIIIHLGRLRDKSRKVLEIAEVVGYRNGEVILRTLYIFEEAEEDKEGNIWGNFVRKGDLQHVEKLRAAGIPV